MNESIHKYLSELGKKGHAATKKKYGVKQMQEWGRLGGRPKKAAKQGRKPARQLSTG